MATKTFSQAPKPKPLTDDDISAFERGGVGHDNGTLAKNKSKRIEPPQEPTKRLSLDLPESKHRRFKTACSATGHKMVQEIEAFIDARTAELEAQAGITRK
jgi:16S rRNA U516 pseudouridylate synthase RsuA-like enzyme